MKHHYSLNPYARMFCKKMKCKTKEIAETRLLGLKNSKPFYWGKVYWCYKCGYYHFGRQGGQSSYWGRTGRKPNDLKNI